MDRQLKNSRHFWNFQIWSELNRSTGHVLSERLWKTLFLMWSDHDMTHTLKGFHNVLQCFLGCLFLGPLPPTQKATPIPTLRRPRGWYCWDGRPSRPGSGESQLSSQKQNDFGREGLFTIGLTESGRVWKSLFSWTSMLTTSPSTAVKPLI